MSLGENEQAAAYIEESLALRRRIGDVSRIALSLCNVAATALLKGDIARAAALFAEAAEIATAIGDKPADLLRTQRPRAGSPTASGVGRRRTRTREKVCASGRSSA